MLMVFQLSGEDVEGAVREPPVAMMELRRSERRAQPSVHFVVASVAGARWNQGAHERVQVGAGAKASPVEELRQASGLWLAQRERAAIGDGGDHWTIKDLDMTPSLLNRRPRSWADKPLAHDPI